MVLKYRRFKVSGEVRESASPIDNLESLKQQFGAELKEELKSIKEEIKNIKDEMKKAKPIK